MSDTTDIVPIREQLAEQGQHELRQKRAIATRGGKMTRMKRRNRVLELRAAGLSEEQIGEQLGLTQGRVSKIITRALEDWAKQDTANADLIRQQKLFELDQLKRAIWTKALKGDLQAVREAVRIIQVQARLSGAEAPHKIERHTTVDIEIDAGEVRRMEQAWLDSGGDIIEGTLREELE